MKGLLLKDLYTVYSYKKQYTLIVGFMLIWAIFMKNVAFISIYMLILGGMLVLSSMSTDEAVHFNRLALTMPISPATLVKSKYILLIITMGGGTILACIINAICLQFLNKRARGKLILYKEEEQYIVTADEVVYVEVSDNKGYAYTKTDTYEAKQKLYEVRDILSSQAFVQINKSVIVNINCVKSIQAEFSGNYRLKLKNRKESLTISRKYFKEFKDRI